MNPSFIAIPFTNGQHFIDGDISVSCVTGGEYFPFIEGTYFAFVAKGLAWYNSDTPIKSGMYGCFTGGNLHTEHSAKVLIIHDARYDGMRMFGGPVERTGRLKYIDG